MKKTYSIVSLLLVLLSACNNADAFLEEASNGSTTKSNPMLRTESDAIDIALANLSALDNAPAPTSRTTPRTIKNVSVIGANGTKSRSGLGLDTLLYVVNFDNNNGFAIVPAPKQATSILALAEYGNYDVDQGSECPGLEQYMLLAREYALETLSSTMTDEITKSRSFEIDTNLKPYDPDPNKQPWETKEEETTTIHYYIPPRVTLGWGQRGTTYAKYAKNGYCGCGPLAIGLAMTYFHQPEILKITFDNNKHSLILNWDRINTHTGSRSCGCGDAADTNHETIAQVLRQIGEDADANYNKPDGTSINWSKAPGVFKKYGFNVSDIHPYKSRCTLTMQEGLYAMCGSTATDDPINPNGCHMWLLVGVKQEKIKHTVYYRKYGSDKWEIMSQGTYEKVSNYHNWGWNGLGNGWYDDCVYNTNLGNYNQRVQYFSIYKK